MKLVFFYGTTCGMLSNQSAKDVNYCTACPKMCHFSCPVAEVEKNESVTPWGKQQTAKLIQSGALPLSEEHAASAYHCLTCRGSQTFCQHEISASDSLQELREAAVQHHVAPPEVDHFAKAFKQFHNPYQIDLQERLFESIGYQSLAPSAQTVFFPSCHRVALQHDSMTSIFKLFEKLQFPKAELFSSPLQCCGFSLHQLGLKEDFHELAEIQYNSLRHTETLIVGSPECAWAFRTLYPRFGFSLKTKVLTLTEWITNQLETHPITPHSKPSLTYTYHDSCYTGRYLKLYEAQRRILKQLTGVEPTELIWKKEESLCSGAGGGYDLLFPEYAQQIAERTLQEAQGTAYLITDCPKSAHHFQKSNPTIKVRDWVSFVAELILQMESRS